MIKQSVCHFALAAGAAAINKRAVFISSRISITRSVALLSVCAQRFHSTWGSNIALLGHVMFVLGYAGDRGSHLGATTFKPN